MLFFSRVLIFTRVDMYISLSSDFIYRNSHFCSVHILSLSSFFGSDIYFLSEFIFFLISELCYFYRVLIFAKVYINISVSSDVYLSSDFFSELTFYLRVLFFLRIQIFWKSEISELCYVKVG